MSMYRDIHMFRIKASRDEFYSKNMDCQLVISASTQNEHFSFFVELLDVFRARDCDTDWLELRDGRTTSSPFVDGIYMWAASSEKVPWNMRKMRRFNTAHAQSIIRAFACFKNSFVSIDFVGGQ